MDDTQKHGSPIVIAKNPFPHLPLELKLLDMSDDGSSVECGS